MSFDRGAPALWFVEITLDAETLRHCNAFEDVVFDGNTYEGLGDRFTAPADIDRAANLKSQKFKLTYDSSRQTDNLDPIGKILDNNWKRRPIRVRYAVGDMDADGFDFSSPTIIADETGRIINLEDTLSAGDAPSIEMEIESGALIFLERRNQTRSPANQRRAFADDAFFDLARQLDGAVLPWRTKKARQGSAQITYEVDGVAPPRQMIIGRGITRGTFVFGCTIDVHRSRWCQVYALADHQCEALEHVYINGVDVMAGESALVHGVRKTMAAFNSGGPRLYLTWYDGRHDQTADSRLISGTAAQPLKWTSAHRGRGVSYVVIEHAWDSDLSESYSYEFVVKGAKIYQERLDSTAGGSGSHRLDDPETWTWTENAEEALRHYLRGRVVSPSSSYKWFGVGAPDAFLDPYALYLYRAAQCDEAVTLSTGGAQARYTANGWISASDDHKKNIQKLADCMVADPVDEGGRISIRLSEPQTPVVTLTDADLMEDAETVASPNARADDVVNRIEGQFTNPANKYASEDYAPIESATFEEIDGEQITGSWKQELENNEERAQRKATLYLNKQRRTVEFEETFGAAAHIVRPGDWITRESDLRGFPAGKLFIADEVRRFVDGSVRLLLLEVDPGELVWDEASAVLTPPPTAFARETEPLAVPEITVTAIAVSGAGVVIPAVRFAVATYDVAMGDEVLCEFGIWNGLAGLSAAIVGDSDFIKIPGNFQTYVGAKGLLPGTGYAFRFRARDGEKLSDWSAFETLTATGTYQAGSSAIADSIVGQGWGATASQAAADNTYVPNGVNQLVDHDFRFGATYWRTLVGSGSHTAAENETLRIRRKTVTGSGVTVGSYIQADTFPDRTRFACKAGDLVEGSGYISGSNLSNVLVYLIFYNAADATLLAVSTTFAAPGSGVASLADFTRMFKLYVAPANTAYARLAFQATASSSAPVLHVAKPMLAVANSGQTAPTAWNPGLAYTPGADPTAANTAAAITGQGWGATASQAAADNTYVPNGVNQLVDHDFRFGSTYLRALANTSGSVSTAEAETAGLRRRTITGAGVTVGHAIQFDSYPDRARFVCAAGDLIEASAYVSQSNCSLVRVFLQPYNAAGTALAGSSFGDFTPGSGTSQISDFTRVYKLAVMPANTAYCLMGIRGIASTSAPVLHVAKPMLAVANSGQTAPTAWNPGLAYTPGADPTAANTAAAIAGQGSGATANDLAGLNATDDQNARARIVEDFTRDGYHWTTDFGSAPGTQADPAAATYATVANVGRVIRLTPDIYLQPKGAFRPAIGRRYLVVCDVIVTANATGGTLRARPFINGLSSTWFHGAASYTNAAPIGSINDKNPIAVSDGLVTLAAVFTCTAISTYDAAWRPRLDLTRSAGSGGEIEVRRFRVFDVTDVSVGRNLTDLIRADGTTPVAESAIVTALGTAAAITGQGWGATASEGAASNALIPLSSGNAIGNSELRTGIGGWLASNTGPQSSALSLRAAGSTWAMPTRGTISLFQADATATGYCDLRWRPRSTTGGTAFALKVQPGDIVGARVHASAHRCLVQLRIEWKDANGTILSYSGIPENNAVSSSSTEPDQWPLLSLVATAPASAAWAELHIRKNATLSGENSYAFLHKPMLAILPPGTTAVPAYSPGIALDVEPGADPTSENTAAAVTGQGPGATAAGVDVLNTNIATRGLLSARPASGAFAGQLYFATDTGQQFEWTGSAWSLRADITAQSQLTIAATATTVNINCDSAGVPAAGQLPRTVGLTLKLGNNVVSADAAWSIVSAGAATASVDDSATAAAGNLTVTALPSNADVIVSGTYGGVTLRITVSFNRLLAPPPVTGSGGGTSASDTSIIDPAGTSFAVVSDTLTVTTGSGGQVRLVANVDYNHFGFIGQRLIGRWQRNISGTWTDVGTEVTGTNSYSQPDAESGSIFDQPGTLSIDQTITGLGASTSQSFRLRTRRSGGTSWSVYGNATAIGS